MIVTSFKRNRNMVDNPKRQILLNQNSEIAINNRNIEEKKPSEHADDRNGDIIEKKIPTNADELEDNPIISSKGIRKIQKNNITIRLGKLPEILLEEDSSNKNSLVSLPNIHRHKINKNDKKRSSTFTKSLKLKYDRPRENSLIRPDSKQNILISSFKKPKIIHKLNYLNYIPYIDYSPKPNKTCYNVIIVL